MELHEHSCCDMQRVNKGAWTHEEDALLTAYMEAHGNECQSWKDIVKNAGLRRCRKSCRFRWLHYLRPSLDRRSFTVQEAQLISNLHTAMGNKWTEIAKFLPGRSDNSIKNFWNAYCKEPYPSIRRRRRQQQQPPLPTINTTTLTNTQPILQQQHHNPSLTNYDFTHDQFFTISPSVINTPSLNHQNNLQASDDPPSISYDLPPFPESLIPSPHADNTLEIGAYDYNSNGNNLSAGWIDPSYSHNQVLLDHHSSNYVYDQNHQSFFNHVSTSNNPSDMTAQAPHWDLHNSHGFINTNGDQNYPLDPYVTSNHHHGNNL